MTVIQGDCCRSMMWHRTKTKKLNPTSKINKAQKKKHTSQGKNLGQMDKSGVALTSVSGISQNRITSED